MLHYGLKDDHIPQNDVDQIAAAHPEVPIYRYPAGHAFNNDRRPSYEPESARQALERTLPFLRQNI
jgi:carboxymethylenebutenolidase